jgi:hypothetical protein
MIKCKDCKYYKPTSAKFGTCYGVKIKGDRDPAKGSDKCRGKYFKPKESSSK